MKRHNSIIKQKKCKCSADCVKFPTIGYAGYYINHYPGEKNKKMKDNDDALTKLSKQLKRVQGLIRDAAKTKSKGDYLKIADILFSNFIKRRDSNNGKNIVCICCKKGFMLNDKDSSGNYIVQALHFVPRGTYSLRYDERNVHAGCSHCNLMMHLESEGSAYQNYRQYLIDSLGKEEVEEMETHKRRVNKLTEEDLKEIIKKYKSLIP